jgi:hypothetical protein
MEVENAVNAARKELAYRFDFKGSKAEIVLEKSEIKLAAEDQFKMNNLVEIVLEKLAKRSISMKNVERCEPDLSPLGHARQLLKIKQGLGHRHRQGRHRLHPSRQVQSHHPDPGCPGPGHRQKPGRVAGGHQRGEGQGLSARASVPEFPRLTRDWWPHDAGGQPLKSRRACGKSQRDAELVLRPLAILLSVRTRTGSSLINEPGPAPRSQNLQAMTPYHPPARGTRPRQRPLTRSGACRDQRPGV